MSPSMHMSSKSWADSRFRQLLGNNQCCMVCNILPRIHCTSGITFPDEWSSLLAPNLGTSLCRRSGCLYRGFRGATCKLRTAPLPPCPAAQEIRRQCIHRQTRRCRLLFIYALVYYTLPNAIACRINRVCPWSGLSLI